LVIKPPFRDDCRKQRGRPSSFASAKRLSNYKRINFFTRHFLCALFTAQIRGTGKPRRRGRGEVTYSSALAGFIIFAGHVLSPDATRLPDVQNGGVERRWMSELALSASFSLARTKGTKGPNPSPSSNLLPSAPRALS